MKVQNVNMTQPNISFKTNNTKNKDSTFRFWDNPNCRTNKNRRYEK